MEHDDAAWVVGSPRPLRPSGWRPIQIVSVKPGMRIKCYALTELTVGYHMHFEGKSRICYNPQTCDLCKARLARRWKGYLPCCTHDGKMLYVLEVTEKAGEKLDELKAKVGTITNNLLVFSRKGGRRNSPLMMEAEIRRLPKEMQPEPFPVVPSVLYLFGYTPDQISDLIARSGISPMSVTR